MDTTEPNKGKHTSGAVGTRVFENPWPVTDTNQHINSQPSSPAISGGSIFASHTDSRGRMASTSLQEKPPTGIGITRFIGDQRLNNTLFPPGPQKIYHRKYPLPSIRGTDIKPRYTRSVSELRKDFSNEPPELITYSTNFSEQQRVKDKDKLAVTNNDRLENEKLRGDSDSDEDGGVVLASSLAVFMQSPGNVKFPVRFIVPKADAVDRQQETRGFEPERKETGHQEQQQQKTEQLISPRKEQEEPKTEVIKKPLSKPRSSMASQMAALLQTPGALNFVSRHPSAPVLAADFPTPVYRAGSVGQRRGKRKDEEEEEEGEEEEEEKQEEKRNEEWEKLQRWSEEDDKGKKKEGAYERKIEEELTHAGARSVFNEPHPSTKLLDSQAGKFEDLDATRYWGTPNTPFVYARPTSPPTTAQKESNLPRPERRAFRHLKDGDIVGDEAFELPKANKGRLMMEKMGYKEGTPLGNGDGGLIEPVKVEVRLGNRGLGLAKQDPGLPTHASTSQVNSSQMAPTHMTPAGMSGMSRGGSFQQLSYGITQQLQQMNIATLQQAVGYSLVTPLGTYQTRLRMVQILSYLDALELLDIVDYNHILAASMNRVAEDQIKSRLGFLVETELVQIVTREYKKAMLRKRGGGNTASSYGVMDKGYYW